MNKDDRIISANQFSGGQKMALVAFTIAILILAMLGSYLLFKNYQLRRVDSKTSKPELTSQL